MSIEFFTKPELHEMVSKAQQGDAFARNEIVRRMEPFIRHLHKRLKLPICDESIQECHWAL